MVLTPFARLRSTTWVDWHLIWNSQRPTSFWKRDMWPSTKRRFKVHYKRGNFLEHFYFNVLLINIWRGIDIARKIKSFHAHLYSGEIIWKIVFDSKKFLNSCNLKYFKKYHLSWAVLIFGQEVSQITAGAVVCQTICWSSPVSKDIYFRYMFKIDRK